MPKNYFKESNLFKAMKKMPPLKHSIPGESFSLARSEVVKWLVSIPAAQLYLFERAKTSGAITYNANTGEWVGQDYED